MTTMFIRPANAMYSVPIAFRCPRLVSLACVSGDAVLSIDWFR